MQQHTQNETQGKKFLFERSNLNRQTPTILFEKWELGQVKCSNSSANLPQFNLSCKQSFENVSNSFYTPPMEKGFIPTPKAPVKYKKQVKKGDLKPKKLHYSDDELDTSSAVDSGIHMQFDQSNNTLFYQQHSATCNRSDSPQKQLHRLRVKLDRVNVQTNDKENDKNVIGNRSANISSNKNNAAQKSSVVFNPNEKVLSFCDPNLDWKETLYWLQPRRDVGLWIECCRKTCKKWRYVEDYHDPLDVPEIWYCEMNSDKSMASCDILEQPRSFAIESDLIENKYNAGSIVWAHVKDFPWWPGIVNDCPDTYTYYRLPKNSLIPTRYFVTFFNEEKLECAWVHKQKIKPFASHKYSELINTTIFHGIDYKQPLKKACDTATNALSLSILERLKQLSFVSQYEKHEEHEKHHDINNNLNQSINNITKLNTLSQMDIDLDDEIPCSNPIQRQIPLKQYYLEVLCKRRETQ